MEHALTAAPRLSVILVTWNSAVFLPRCLDGIRRQSEPLELIHVDNASDDDSVTVVRAAFPECAQHRNDTNLGFTVAVNQGLRLARGAFVLLCNPDAHLEPDYAALLIEALASAGEEFGMAAGTLMRATGPNITATRLVDSKGIRMTRTGRHLDIGQGLRDGADDRGLRPFTVHRSPFNVVRSANGERRTAYEIFGPSGAAALYRMSFVRDVSVDGEFFDEDFFTFREDADVAWRGRLFGWRALHVPDAVGSHVRTVTPGARRHLSPSINRYSVRNRFLLRMKNEGAYLALRNGAFEIPRDLLTIAAVLTVEWTSLPALTWLWKNRRRIMAKRRAIQSRRRVSDRQLAGWFR